MPRSIDSHGIYLAYAKALEAKSLGAAMVPARTQTEILARLKVARLRPSFELIGAELDALLPNLDFEFAQELLAPEATKQDWDNARGEWDLRTEILLCLTRALSQVVVGGRPFTEICFLVELAWLAGRDDLVKDIEETPFTNYVYAIRLVAYAFGFEDVWEEAGKEVHQLVKK